MHYRQCLTKNKVILIYWNVTKNIIFKHLGTHLCRCLVDCITFTNGHFFEAVNYLCHHYQNSTKLSISASVCKLHIYIVTFIRKVMSILHTWNFYVQYGSEPPTLPPTLLRVHSHESLLLQVCCSSQSSPIWELKSYKHNFHLFTRHDFNYIFDVIRIKRLIFTYLKKYLFIFFINILCYYRSTLI